MKNPLWPPQLSTSLVIALVCILAIHWRAEAQARQEILTQVTVEGTTRFSDSQIAAASGLKVGQPANDSNLSAAADQLSKSGDFSEVTYRYKTLNGKLSVTFLVVEEPKTMSCVFDNFVWFASGEADLFVRAEVPLYDGRLPLDGDVVPAVAAALEHLLAQHHVSGTVTYLPASNTPGTPPTEFRFSANGNLPPITSVEFAGGPLDPALFAVQKQRLMGHPYSAAYARALAARDLDVIYQNHAYLRAHFGDPQTTFVPGAGDSDPGTVKLTFTVVPGPEYAWHGADWTGNAVYSSPDLDHILGMKEGDSAQMDKITAGMDAVRTAYGAKGYITASVSPKQVFDDAASQVRYAFDLKEGSQYHMGALSTPGIDDKTAERIRKGFRLKTGDIYDATYMKVFITKDFGQAISGTPLAARIQRTRINTHANQDTLTLDVTVSLPAD